MYLSLDQRKVLALYALRRRRTAAKKRRVWVHEILQQRQELGVFRLVQELQLYDDRFQVYFRLSREKFENLLGRVAPRITKMTTNLRKPISPTERLAICLRYLATGDAYTTIASSYRVGISTVAKIVPEVCQAIRESLVEEYLPVPQASDWIEISQGFKDRWNFPHCLGALDGKHVVIQAPAHSGSHFYNYKGTYSPIPLALVDANYCFRVVDVGGYGRSSDGGILSASSFGQALKEGRLYLPEDAPLPGADDLGPMPYVFVADEAFPLKKNMLRPYPGRNLTTTQRIFNHRLSRARRVVENAFGILAAQWRIYHRVIGVSPQNVDWVVKATVALHNFQRWNSTSTPQADNSVEAEGIPALEDLQRAGSNYSSQGALAIREKFSQYFESAVGAVPWQNNF